MKIFTAILCYCVLGILVVSCQKEVDGNINSRPVHVSEGTILEAYVELDTTELPGTDTISIRRYYYDNLGRISKSTEKYFQRGTANFSSYTDFTRVYTGIDSFPSLITSNSILENGVIVIDTIFLSYYADNIVKKDSARKYINSVLDSYSSFLYNRLDNTTYLISGSAFQAGNPIPTNHVLIKNIFSSGNLVFKYDSAYSQPPSTFWGLTKLDYQYDAYNNPYRNITLRYVDISHGFGGYTKNNPTSYLQSYYSSSNNIPSTTNYMISYTYNSFGYPVTIDFNVAGQYFKTHLFYKN